MMTNVRGKWEVTDSKTSSAENKWKRKILNPATNEAEATHVVCVVQRCVLFVRLRYSFIFFAVLILLSKVGHHIQLFILKKLTTRA